MAGTKCHELYMHDLVREGPLGRMAAGRIGMSPCKPVRMATTKNLKPNIPSHSAPSPSLSPHCRLHNSVQAHWCVIGEGRTMITGIRATTKPLLQRDPGITTKQAALATQIHCRHRAQLTYQHHLRRRSQPRNTATSTSLGRLGAALLVRQRPH
jgi:hypothetical protein